MDFSKIAGSVKASKFANLMSAVDRSSAGAKKTYDKDETYWFPKRDDEKKAKAVIRFLPGLESENEPCFVELQSHSYKNVKSGKWLFENCPRTIKKECPICQHLYDEVQSVGGWDVAPKTVKDYYSLRKGKKGNIANILVINDPATPENNGKVFKYKFGKKILDKIFGKAQPEFDDVEPVNVFDYTEGCNFRLSICEVEGFANYDLSTFDAPSALDKDTIKRVKAEQLSLLEIIADDKFKSEEELKKNFLKVEGKPTEAQGENKKSPSLPQQEPEQKTEDYFPSANEGTDSGSDDDYFAKLAGSLND
jgi:hypothetical protein